MQKWYTTVLALGLAGQVFAQNPLVVKVNQPKAEIQPTMWGLFFEDINMGADGGLYAELIKNRSFEFESPMMGWKEQKNPKASVLVLNRQDQPENPRFIRVKTEGGKYGLTNEGFRGMGVKQGVGYDFSVLSRNVEGNLTLKLELIKPDGQVLGTASLPLNSTDWKKHSVRFTSNGTEPKAKLNVWFEGTGTADLDMISLFPQDTWKNRPGGLRADLVQLLADMKPGFLRFPGGCIVEGMDLSNRYQWKKTVGPLEGREVAINRWNKEFKHRLTPDYFQTFGLGFFEYFQLAEDIGAEPLPILNCGMACQYNTAEVVPVEELDPYVQDALDLIEFANGSTDTKWGKLRADMGHPAPFNLKLLGVGNEQWGPQYIDRYVVFEKAIKSKYPEVRLISSAGPNPDGEVFGFLNGKLRSLKADIIDEHYYRKPEWFLENATRYDDYDRNGPKIFAGEYASQSKDVASPENRNTWLCALSEAAFMTGLERNADVVHMASYAPLFAHADGWQWTPDLIWMNNLQSYGTPNYYVQKLYSTNKGTKVLPILSNNQLITGKDQLYASATWDEPTKEVILKLVNASSQPQTHTVNLEGVKKLENKGKRFTLKSSEPGAVNSFDQPKQVSPTEEELAVKGTKLNLTLAPQSFTVVRVKVVK
ncbi:alpha-L-arabinofuranosidase C-terminal domain-containing protein [Siphonobacter curvatus]|uniref:non-reducing end alpha-L-arabinofuranosidase n=1 Tax=Siphonobacter curvatus TaxID=2094562 RepID=A0A2S7ILT7_9BACT|nr:alpha-L-arabinofuranosidase C-terminal domain-containing protein [Siphonobacter curvatus]PQA58588.1 alpha-L-arabinofuranosidase [Siphonobacter curvatus]